jgi:hypothetical protein
MPEIIEAKHGSEQGHFYYPDGRPAYTYLNKKGEEKPTTLREARKLGLWPGCTTVIKLASQPGLINWIIDQHILAALSLPRIPDETDDEFVARIKEDAKAQAKRAAEIGTTVHACVQSGFENKLLAADAKVYYLSAREALNEAVGCLCWKSEQSFAKDGYGGKVDLHTWDLEQQYVVDIKSTTKPLEGLKTWDEHSLQLAAYRHGLGMDDARCFILYIHTETAESKLIELDSKELEKGWKCFAALLQFFYAKTSLGV